MQEDHLDSSCWVGTAIGFPGKVLLVEAVKLNVPSVGNGMHDRMSFQVSSLGWW
jgi:hypothetical protein